MVELPPSEVSPEEAREIADQVLRGRAYVEAGRPPSLPERIFEWIGDVIGELLNALSSTGGRGVTAWIIFGLFAALIAFLATRLVRQFGPLPVGETAPDPVVGIDKNRPASEWLDAAVEAEDAGDWRLGIRCRHRALVTTLVDRGIVATRPGQTAGEIASELAKERPAAAAEMQRATWLFKDVWYGWVEAGPEHRDEFQTLSDQVLSSTEPAMA